MRKNKNRSKIILATMVAVLATVISYSAFSNMNKQLTAQKKLINLIQATKSGDEKETFTYAVSTKDLKSGEMVSDADVDFKEFTSKDLSAFENRSEVVNKILLKDIAQGESFTADHIAKISLDNIELKEGFRALTLPANNFKGRSNKMVAGSYVDIFSTDNNEVWGLENVKILALEGSTGGTSATDAASASSITFEVAPDEIADFITDTSKNNLVLVARSSNDKKRTAKYRPKQSISSWASYPSLPSLPASVPIENMSGGVGLSGLPTPMKPEVPMAEVELIEANVKSKVTFD